MYKGIAQKRNMRCSGCNGSHCVRTTFQDIKEALKECDDNDKCQAVEDILCDGKNFYLCDDRYTLSKTESDTCIYEKGKIIFDTFFIKEVLS